MHKILSVLAFPAALALLTPAALADRIVKKDGSVITDCTVTDWTFRELSYRAGGRDNLLPADEVASAEITNVRRDFERAHNIRAGGDERVAYETYLKIAEEKAKGGRSGRFTAQFGYWDAIQLKLGLDDGAREAFPLMDEMLAACPETRFLPAVFATKIEYYLGRGTKEGQSNAKKVANNYRQTCDEKQMLPFFVKEAEFYQLLVNRISGELPATEAREAFRTFVNETDGRFSGLANKARVEVGATLLDEKKLEEAQEYFNQIIKSGDSDSSTMARAHLGRGLAVINKPDKTPEDAREALLDFLRVHALYSDTDNVVVAEALYHAEKAMLFTTLDNRIIDARRIRYRLKNDPRYRNTTWAKK